MKQKANLVKVTAEGLEKLKQELQSKLDKRDVLRERIEETRSAGDLRENDGYSLALDENHSNEIEIKKLEHQIDNAVVVESQEGRSHLGSTVTLETDDGTKVIYTLVGENEVDPLENKIAESSPIGAAITNKTLGDKVQISLPKGTLDYTVIDIA